MFDGVPEQFHQFIAPRSTLPLHLPFPPFDAYGYNPSNGHLPLPPPPTNLLHPLHHKDEQHKQEENSLNLEINERQRQLSEHEHEHEQLELVDSWSNDEVLALLRIRSSMDTNWFPELTWEHVSRKLAELGFKKSADKCKEKFEEETRYFNNNIHYTKNNNYRFISELEQLYQQQETNQIPEDEVESQKSEQQLERPTQEQHKKMVHPLEEGLGNDASLTKECEESMKTVEKSKHRKRKRYDKFEMLKGFCENIVNKMMAQQEQMHNKLLEDMLKRDQEKLAREEAWKKQEIERMNRELEMMAKELAIAGDRQATIIESLKKFSDQSHHIKTVSHGSNPNSLACSPLNSQNPNPSSNYIEKNNPEPPPPTPISTTVVLNCEDAADRNSNCSSGIPSSSNCAPDAQNPNSLITQHNPSPTKSVSTHKACSNSCSSTEKDEVGRRWPREEVLALINLRCSVNNNNSEEKDGGSRGPLWERVSQGMWELGYKRSAKRCKEKWENINKYFRKTKDVSKKRSLDSRTCPYFHQLTTLYSQGKLMNAHSQSHDPRSPQSSHHHASADDETSMQQRLLPPPPPPSDSHRL